jgi:hypothetical protein
MFGDQVSSCQLGQQHWCFGDGLPGEAGGGVAGDVWTRGKSEKPEQSCRWSGKAVVGPGEHCLRVAGCIPGIKPAEAVARFA